MEAREVEEARGEARRQEARKSRQARRRRDWGGQERRRSRRKRQEPRVIQTCRRGDMLEAHSALP